MKFRFPYTGKEKWQPDFIQFYGCIGGEYSNKRYVSPTILYKADMYWCVFLYCYTYAVNLLNAFNLGWIILRELG